MVSWRVFVSVIGSVSKKRLPVKLPSGTSPSITSQRVILTDDAFPCCGSNWPLHSLIGASFFRQMWNCPAGSDALLPVSESTMVECVTCKATILESAGIVTANPAAPWGGIRFHGEAEGSSDHARPGLTLD